MTNNNNNEHYLNTTFNKDFNNPVQVDADKTMPNRGLDNPPNVQEERKMREKTAQIGLKASHASQGEAPVADTAPVKAHGDPILTAAAKNVQSNEPVKKPDSKEKENKHVSYTSMGGTIAS
mmetsp:Transcript_17401/g.30316  ORF Transcript_17401/g.30316 Transcript_17401/m.30316 type:complete len:121 (-) Transcript_17401:1222-1584(-)